jgi:hypothetical protein
LLTAGQKSFLRNWKKKQFSRKTSLQHAEIKHGCA